MTAETESRNDNKKMFDLLTKCLSILTLPALAWIISLSAERATVEIRITALERRVEQQETTTKEITQLVQQNAKMTAEMRITLQYLRADLAEVKKMLEQP